MSEVTYDLWEFMGKPQPKFPARPDKMFVVVGRGMTHRTVQVTTFDDGSAAVVDDPAKILAQGALLVPGPDGVYDPVSSGSITTGPAPQQPAPLDPDRVKELLDLLQIVAGAADVILLERGEVETDKYLAGLSEREKNLIVQLDHEFKAGARALSALTFLLNNLEQLGKEVPQAWIKNRIQEAVSFARGTAENKS